MDRQHLSGLEERVLADMGLTRAEVDREALQPFWRPLFSRSQGQPDRDAEAAGAEQ